MSDQLKLSIAMCTYNGARYLQEQLASIVNQTRLPDELVICDDGSNDGTLSILTGFAAKATFKVQIEVTSQHLGATQNFAKAISLCNGHIIVLSDQDDVWCSEKLAEVESTFISEPQLGAVFSNARLINDQGFILAGSLWDQTGFSEKKQNNLRNNSAFNLLLLGNFVTGATLAFRASWRELILPIPNRWVHDYWISLLLAAASKFDFIDKKLIDYRCHPEQQLGLRGASGQNISERIQRLVELENSAYLIAARNCEDIRDRLREYDATRFDIYIRKAGAIADHFRRRGHFPRQLLFRLPKIVEELCSGNYFYHSTGIKGIFRDLLSDSWILKKFRRPSRKKIKHHYE